MKKYIHRLDKLITLAETLDKTYLKNELILLKKEIDEEFIE